LALLAGPLSLPPLAVAGFILVSSHLTFKRALQGLQEEHDNLWIDDWHRLRAAAINCLRKTRICESLAEKEAQEYWLI
jgi:hypothetical protein